MEFQAVLCKLIHMVVSTAKLHQEECKKNTEKRMEIVLGGL